MPAHAQVNLLRQLDLLVSTGVGIAPIAPALSPLLSKIVGADSYGLSWFDEAGLPEGFYHCGAQRQAEELFMNHYEELFVGPHEYTPFWRTLHKTCDVGNALRSSQAYFRSNTYNLLIKPSGWHFLLDAMIELDGVTRLSVSFFRSEENPFTESDEKKLTALIPMLRRAIPKRPHGLTSRYLKAAIGYLLVTGDGRHMDMLDSHAQNLLSSAKLFDQNLSLTEAVATPPRFVQHLCERLSIDPAASAETEIDLAGGSLYVRASRLAPMATMPPAPLLAPAAMFTNKPASSKILVAMQFRQASAMGVVQSISAWGLSPLQGRIALYAAGGGSRIECAAHHSVSKEALKKHLRQIYAASRCTDWQELSHTLAEQ